MKKMKDMSIGELGALVCSHLEEKGIRVTLTGGACVSIYTDNRYKSMDLDFVEEIGLLQIQRWSEGEGELEKFESFFAALSK